MSSHEDGLSGVDEGGLGLRPDYTWLLLHLTPYHGLRPATGAFSVSSFFNAY